MGFIVWQLNLLCSTCSQQGLNPIKPVYDWRRLNGRLS